MGWWCWRLPKYHVEYVVHDVESLVFWLSSLDLRHADLAGGTAVASVEVFNEILRGNVDDRGFITNEHRYLMVAQRSDCKVRGMPRVVSVMDDVAFIDYVGRVLLTLPGVEAVTLGGSRAEGTNRPDSDWDFALYYRGQFQPQRLREIGWPGVASEIGGWSAVDGGVFNGGAWLEIDGRRSDVHYRDLDVVDRVIASTREGHFEVEPLWFHLAGLPSYLVLAELAVSKTLVGEVPEVSYPEALRKMAPGVWWEQAETEFDYARKFHAAAGRLTQCVGLLARATSCAAHAVLAARGAWVTNEKQLLIRAGLSDIDRVLSHLSPDPAALREAVDTAHTACSEAVRSARLNLEQA